MPKVLVSDKLSPRAFEIFAERGVDAANKQGLSAEELAACIGEYDGLAIRSNTKVTAALLKAATNLKVIGRAGIGVDNVDVPAATAAGVIVMNTPYGNAITTAEHAIALMFAVARQIPAANASTHAGKWEKSKFMGVELTGKTLGIIGCGNIGSIVAERALGLKMQVIAYDPLLTEERAADLGVEKVELEDIWARAHFITLHTPLNDKTRNIVNAQTLAACRKGVRIINCARGGLVDEEALAAALRAGHVAGAGFDVFVEEPAKTNPLFGLENVVCTPHLGAATTEAQENVALQVAEQMSDYLTTGAITNAVNMPSVSAEDAPRLRPYLQLAEQIGALAGQILDEGFHAITIEYEGHVASLNTRPITNMLLMGLLQTQFEGINIVNAPAVAREHNIALSETRHEREGDYATLIRLRINTAHGSLRLAGSLFNRLPRLVMIDDVTLEAEITQHMLFMRNSDKPGLIGRLGVALGGAGINVANFILGREAPGGNAVALISLDSAVPDTLIEKIRGTENVLSVHGLEFKV